MLVRILALALLLSSSVHASEDKRARVYKEVMPEYFPYAKCAAMSAAHYGLNEIYVLAVLLQERGPIKGRLPTKNGSFDYGVTGINTVREQEIERIGLSLNQVGSNPCAAIHAAAYLLAEEIKEFEEVFQIALAIKGADEFRSQGLQR